MSGAVAAESLRRITVWGLRERREQLARARRRGMSAGTFRPRPARRRGFPWWLLVAAFIVVPILEIYVIIQVGQVIGAWWTILLLIADSIFGAWLIKHEGGRAWQALHDALETGRMPATRARRRRADPGRRHADAQPGLRHRHRSGSC